MVRGWMLAVAVAALVAPAQAAVSWAETAGTDLKAIHDLIEANHPGPVDPENPHFREWLDKGYAKAAAEAKTAVSQADYERVLRAYVNGFRDGHVGAGLKTPPSQVHWTGFSVYGRSVDDIRVLYAEPDAGVKAGDRLIACDGKSLDALMAERTDRYWWNAAIPHTRTLALGHLFFQDAADPLPTLKSCTFASGKVVLAWRDEAVASVRSKQAPGRSSSSALRLTKLDGVWVLSLPTFNLQSEAAVAAFNAVLQDIAAHRSELATGPVVIDVRGNGGGSSTWGDKIAVALWGPEWVGRIHKMSDGTLDFRASPDNLARIDAHIATFTAREGAQSHMVQSLTRIRQGIAAALERHQPLARFDDKVEPVGDPPANPMQGKVYFLTDNACGSACLDFADIVLKIPGVTHVGLPTYADSLYMDADKKILPSGLSILQYPMKVYRHRARKNNEYYVPKALWTGGPMTDDAAVIAWVKSLP